MLGEMAEIFPDLEELEIIARNQLNHCAVAEESCSRPPRLKLIAIASSE